jgi:hypothetical protein
MKFDDLSNRVTENWARDYWSRFMSSVLDLFVLFVSFVVKQICPSARGISLMAWDSPVASNAPA